MLGYLCAYYRYYYPIEFITAFLNNAANDEDIRNGTNYATRIGIKMTMPKWGVSKDIYPFDKEQNVIAKGLSSIKYMSAGTASVLYKLAHERHYEHFVDVLQAIKNSSVNARQLDILIKIDFFSEFGNQRELLRIVDAFDNLLAKGEAKVINKAKLEDSPFRDVVEKYSTGVTKSGAVSKSYLVQNMRAILVGVEGVIKDAHLQDLSDSVKAQNFKEAAGYVGYASGKEEDRRKLYIMEVYPLTRKSDGKQFGYSVVTKSIGSGKESRFTLLNSRYKKNPISEGNIIICKSWIKDGQYFRLLDYEVTS